MPPAHRCPRQQRQRVTEDRYGPIEWAQLSIDLSECCKSQYAEHASLLSHRHTGQQHIFNGARYQ